MRLGQGLTTAKSFLASDNGGVLAGPLVQLAAGGKPSLQGLADPADLFHTPPPTTPASPAAPPPTPPPVNPNLAPFAAANNAADQAQQDKLTAQKAAASGGVGGNATGAIGSVLSDGTGKLNSYG
jgi:hypothetical protein